MKPLLHNLSKQAWSVHCHLATKQLLFAVLTITHGTLQARRQEAWLWGLLNLLLCWLLWCVLAVTFDSQNAQALMLPCVLQR